MVVVEGGPHWQGVGGDKEKYEAYAWSELYYNFLLMMLRSFTRITYSYLEIYLNTVGVKVIHLKHSGEDEGGVGERGIGAQAVDGGGLH